MAGKIDGSGSKGSKASGISGGRGIMTIVKRRVLGGSIAMLLVSLYNPNFLSYLGALSVFLLGMGIVNPLGTAQALSPFGEKAGAASALVGFWQMMTAAIGVWLAATISHEALFALGMVLTVFSIAAVGLYTLRAKAR